MTTPGPPVTAGSHALLWSINARAVLEIVGRDGPVARPEITRATGLSRTAVAQILTELGRRGVVVEAGLDENRRGPAARLYAIEPRVALGAAVDIGHVWLRAAVVDAAGTVPARGRRPAAQASVAELATSVRELLGECCTAAGVSAGELMQVVVGLPAAIEPDGDRLRLASGLPAAGAGLPAALRDALPGQVWLENDTNLAALAEQRTGVGQGVGTFVLLSLGASIGAGIVVDGVLHRGRRGAAGEIAYLPGPADVVDDSLGERSIAADADAAGLGPGLSPREVFDMARDGDDAARAAVDATARRLARVVAAIGLVLDPELVALGGSVGANSDVLLEPVRAWLREIAPNLEVEVVPARAGDDAVIDGAATRCWALLRETAFAQATAY